MLHSTEEFRTQMTCEKGVSPLHSHHQTEVTILTRCKLLLQNKDFQTQTLKIPIFNGAVGKKIKIVLYK